MSKRVIAYFLLLIIMLTGCGLFGPGELPEDPIIFETGTLEADSLYKTILWDGRVYAPYGTTARRSLGRKLGHISGDEETRIYALEDIASKEYLVEYLQTGLMDTPAVYRELDTKGQPAPDVVTSLGYDDLWAE